jgi:hypothetical protein
MRGADLGNLAAGFCVAVGAEALQGDQAVSGLVKAVDDRPRRVRRDAEIRVKTAGRDEVLAADVAGFAAALLQFFQCGDAADLADERIDALL